VRALVVGLGSIGRRHARNWSALGLGEVLVCRRAGRALPEPLGVPYREFNDLETALEERPDVVLVTNPTSLHVETARMAIDASAHVYVEKPLGHALSGVAELLQAARAKKRALTVGYNLRFHPGLQRMRDLLRAGAIGKPISVRAEVGEYLPGWHPYEDYRASYSARRELGGGPLLTFSHELDSVCWLLGAPVRVLAAASHASSLEVDTEDVAEVVLSYGDGAIASVHVDYVRRPPRRTVDILGEEGTLRWEPDANRVLHYASATRQWRLEESSPTFSRNDMFTAAMCDFLFAIQAQPSIGADGEQGAAILSVALAALRSADSGTAIDLRNESDSVRQWLSRL
jgi:predicted dehydrogenase